MKRIIYLIGILLTLIIGTYLYLKFCCCNQKIKEEVKEVITITEEEKKEPTISFGVINANGTISVPLNNGVKFQKSNINFSAPVSAELDNKINQLKNYLVSEEDKSLSITSYYMSDEINNSVFPNIGYARAVSFKNFISTRGIPTKLINIKGELSDSLEVDENNNIKSPMKLSVGKSKDYSKLLESIIKDIESNPLILNFETGKTELTFNHDQRRKIVNISTYLDKVENAFCLITGHTDNTGSIKRNIIIGKQRAEFIKEYFIKSGLQNNRIQTISKGEEEPIGNNNTKEGRAKNRRCTGIIDENK